jgi:hypothetical protein
LEKLCGRACVLLEIVSRDGILDTLYLFGDVLGTTELLFSVTQSDHTANMKVRAEIDVLSAVFSCHLSSSSIISEKTAWPVIAKCMAHKSAESSVFMFARKGSSQSSLFLPSRRTFPIFDG